MKSWVAVTAAAIFLLSACSATEEINQWFTGAEDEWDPVEDLEYPASVSEVAWRWEVPEGIDTSRITVVPVPGGVGAVIDDGIIALSSETGGEMWAYQVSENEVFSARSNDGRYFVLQILDSEDEDAPPRMVVLDLETGEPVQDYSLAGDDDSTGMARGWLHSITDEHWVTASEGGLTAFELGSDQVDWSVQDLVECEDNVGLVDGLTTVEEVTVAGITCYEQPEDEDSVEMTEGREFTSGLVGIDANTGEELWRWEDHLGFFPADSMERSFMYHGNDLLTVEYPYSHTGQIVDLVTGEVATIDEGQVLWSSEDGSMIGVWNRRTRDYRIEDLEGETQEGLTEGEGSADDLFLNAFRGEGQVVGLERGILQIAGEIPSGESQVEFAEFQGFESMSSISLSWGEEFAARVNEARSVPGAVVFSYHGLGGPSGVIGTR